MIGLVSVSPCACICVCVRGDGCDSESVLWWLFAYLSACVCDRERDRGSEHTSSVCERVRERERRRERERATARAFYCPSLCLLHFCCRCCRCFCSSLAFHLPIVRCWLRSWFPLGKTIAAASCQFPVNSCSHSFAFSFRFRCFSSISSCSSSSSGSLLPAACRLPAPLSFWRSRKRKSCGRRRRCFCSGFMTFFCQRTPCHLTHTHTHTRTQQALLLNHREATPFPCAQRVRSSVCI